MANHHPAFNTGLSRPVPGGVERACRSDRAEEVRCLLKDGALCWVRIQFSPVRDLEGRPDYPIALIENIEAQKRAAEKLVAQEALNTAVKLQRAERRHADYRNLAGKG